jgi:cyclohexa-1,5-dienecarbonyl-CoA hydratase
VLTTRYRTIHVDSLEQGTLLRIVLDQPKGNVLSMAMMEELSDALRVHQDDPHLRLILLEGAGGHFSFGASVEEHRKAQAGAMLAGFHRLVRDVASCPVPVGALVEGRCLGGAFELVLCCHLVFAAASARFACPEVKLGVFPPVFAVVGTSRLGGALAERLLLTGEELDARGAERAGLLALLIEDGTDTLGAALDWYRARLQGSSAFALRQAALAGRRGSGLLERLGAPLEAAERQYLTGVLESHDGNEGIEAFLARRTPRWKDA